MKSLFAFFAASMVSVAAMAWPTVGDVVNYDLTVTVHGQTITGDIKMAIQAITPATDSVEFQTITTVAGRSQVENSTQRLSDLNHFASNVQPVLANCQAFGGQPEVVATASGNFQACKIANNSANTQGFIWVADVKFGWVKVDSIDTSNGFRSTYLFRNQN